MVRHGSSFKGRTPSGPAEDQLDNSLAIRAGADTGPVPGASPARGWLAPPGPETD